MGKIIISISEYFISGIFVGIMWYVGNNNAYESIVMGYLTIMIVFIFRLWLHYKTVDLETQRALNVLIELQEKFAKEKSLDGAQGLQEDFEDLSVQGGQPATCIPGETSMDLMEWG